MAKQSQSLREMVYSYFCDQMKTGILVVGDFIDQAEICEKLGISRAPLRDALIQLETEGFVSIRPRRGVFIKPLTLKDIKESYDVLGALEASVILSVFDKITKKHICKMKEINHNLLNALECSDFELYYKLNGDFHDTFLDIEDNQLIKKIIAPIKQRLYDFPLRNYDPEWEKNNLKEHDRLIESLEKKNRQGAASILQYEHWSFSLQNEHIKSFYEL
ncbi:MAG: GntR family transcriptional regulator [Desulfobacterales bacterium]|nr:GntR family transcriptional regulator [Desulfobacterales bacterium]